MAKTEPIPTTFSEDKYSSLQIYHQRTGQGRTEWMHMSGASTMQRCFETLKYKQDGDLIKIAAEYERRQTTTVIGRGTYRKRGGYGTLDTLETIEADGAMIGLVEEALTILEKEREAERLAAEEAARTYPCDYPLCTSKVPASLGPACVFTTIIDGADQVQAFYGCEGKHFEEIRHAAHLVVSLQFTSQEGWGPEKTIRTSRTRTLNFVPSPVFKEEHVV